YCEDPRAAVGKPAASECGLIRRTGGLGEGVLERARLVMSLDRSEPVVLIVVLRSDRSRAFYPKWDWQLKGSARFRIVKDHARPGPAGAFPRGRARVFAVRGCRLPPRSAVHSPRIAAQVQHCRCR